jgi:hypothetical protein
MKDYGDPDATHQFQKLFLAIDRIRRRETGFATRSRGAQGPADAGHEALSAGLWCRGCGGADGVRRRNA